MREEGESVHVASVVVVVNVESLESIVTENANRILSLLTDKTAVTEVETSYEMLVVKRVNVASEVNCSLASVVADDLALFVDLPHILKRDLDVVFLCVGKE